MIWSNLIWSDLIRSDLIWFDLTWSHLTWSHLIRIWLDRIWLDRMWLDRMWLDLIWSDLIWSDLNWSDLIWYDFVWSEFICATPWKGRNKRQQEIWLTYRILKMRNPITVVTTPEKRSVLVATPLVWSKTCFYLRVVLCQILPGCWCRVPYCFFVDLLTNIRYCF